jgi:hypothetical protein
VHDAVSRLEEVICPTRRERKHSLFDQPNQRATSHAE